MSAKNSHIRAMTISFFIVVISFFNFARLSGSENIRAIHIVTLLVCGMAIGIFFNNLFILLKKRN